MAFGNLQEKSGLEKPKPILEVLRGGKFDEIPLIKRANMILPRVQNTSDAGWLFSVFNQYSDLLKDGSLKKKEEDVVEEIVAAAALRLADLGHSVDNQKDVGGFRETEKYNL